MSHTIPVYRAEVEAGVADLVRSAASVAYCVPLETLAGDSPLIEGVRRTAAAYVDRIEANEELDLYYLRDVLVTTGWNRNDDIFAPEELWAARHTSEHKPLNFRHDQDRIIGHILAGIPVDAAMAAIPDDTPVDDLPAKFHIVNGTVIYRNVGSDERRAEIERTLAEIAEGRWFVSMECFFRGFDYGLTGPEGEHRVIARDASTAWLTKYLRAYARGDAPQGSLLGSGRYLCEATGREYRVGRVLRNITFCGKGLVEKPANPESVIFAAAADFTPTYADLGYLTATPVGAAAETNTETPAMAEPNAELDAARATIESLTRQVAELKGQGTEAALAAARAELDAKAAEATALAAEVASLTAQNTTLATEIAATVARAERAEADLAAAVAELAALRAAERTRARVAALAAKNAPDAEALAKSLEPLSDEAFESTVAVLAAAWAAPAPRPKSEAEVAAIDEATPEPEAALAAAAVDDREEAVAEVSDFFAKNVLRTPLRGNRTKVTE